MKISLRRWLVPALCALATGLSARVEYEIYAGPHFNYTHLKFNNPSDLEGYQGGVTTGLTAQCGRYFSNLNFEGTWNAGRITGVPCQRSSLAEYFVELQVGRGCLFCSSWFIPYVGFGWDRFENRQDPGQANLLYQYDKLFIPVGFYLMREFCGWEGALQFEFRPDVYDNLRLVGLNLDPHWGYAFRVQLPFRRDFILPWWKCRHMTFRLVPFFDYNRFGRVRVLNSVEAPLVIPRLERWSAGLRVLVGTIF
ncbi:MAG: hypothetical protein AB7F31_01020 [Parachlamydiales bacterium]